MRAAAITWALLFAAGIYLALTQGASTLWGVNMVALALAGCWMGSELGSR